MSKYIPVEPEKWAEMVKAMAENARLKAEVEALKLGSLLTAVDVMSFIRLKAEVERLRKAGDEMARIIQPPAHGTGEWDGEWDAWNAAKDGKPTE